MLDLNVIRAEFAAYLVAHAATKHSLDAALMHVVEQAYQRGLEDGVKTVREDSRDTPFGRLYGCLGEFSLAGAEDL